MARDFEYDYSDLDYGDEHGAEFRCTNEQCPAHGETYIVKTITEYQGDYPHGGMVDFIDGDTECPDCNVQGDEL